MNQVLNKLFGLDGIGFGSPETEFGFVRPFGAWVWFLVLIGAIALSWWSYKGLSGSRIQRGTLAGVRAALVFTLLLLATGPLLERVTRQTEQDTVIVLLDRSGSLDTPDADGATRDSQLQDLLHAGSESWAQLAESKRVSWFGFHDRATQIASGTLPSSVPALGGSGSDISDALRNALETHAAEPISGIVVVSDGRTTKALDPELIKRLQNARIAIHSVPLGSPTPIKDLQITKVQSQDLVFIDDRAPIRVDLRWTGRTTETASASLQLIDHTTGETLQTLEVQPDHFDDEGTHQYTLHHTIENPGDAQLEIVLRSEPGEDMNPENNVSALTMHAVDRPLRVLYIDGYPRWEQRYLKNLLTREDSIAGTAMLLAADRQYVQDGDVLIDRVPTTKDQWSQYDVIILGDVRAELFTPDQLHGLNEHIAQHGAGLLWIGGPSATPSSWLNSPLAGLLPMRSPDPGILEQTTWDQPVTMRSNEEADRIGVLQLSETGWSERISDPNTGWSQLRLVQKISQEALKPGANVLASAHPIDGSAESSPIVISMRYAGGRVGYIATDEIWRWRYGRGETLPERFWLPMIRMLARGTVARGTTPALLRSAPALPEPGKPVQITLEAIDQALIDSLPESVLAKITRSATRTGSSDAILGGTGNRRIGAWVPEEPGRYTISLESADPMLATITDEIVVLKGSDERRTLDADHALLAELSRTTSGQVFAPDAFADIPAALPNRARTTTLPPEQVSLWDRPFVLIVLVLLLSIEWITRKALRLA